MSGQPNAPQAHVKKWIAICGVIVRDNIPISTQEWHRPKEGNKTFVSDRAKELLWAKLISYFTLPDWLTPEDVLKVKGAALKKMGRLFRAWKVKLWTKYVADKKKTPIFTGALAKVEAHWDQFVKNNESDEAQRRSKINKINAEKHKIFHTMGTGGYMSASPKWDALEKEMMDRGVIPVTIYFPPRCRSWFFGHGGELDPMTGKVKIKASLKGADQEILNAIVDARNGTFIPDRENDELTRALKNPEHPGRTRGVGVVPWYEGFAEYKDTYKSRARKKKQEADRLSKLENDMKEIVEQLSRSQQQQPTQDPPEATTPSMPRSSVGSTGVDDGHYPVDDITEQKRCELIFKMSNISIKVADGFALPNPPGALHHCNPIPPGYARVGVDEVVTEYQELNLDFPGGEGQQTIKEAKQTGIYLWRKQWIIFPDIMSSPTRSTSSSPPPPEMECIPTPQHQPSPAPLPEMERSATPQHQPSPAPSIPEMEHSATPQRQPSPAPLPEMERSATPQRQPSPAPSLPEMERSATPPRQSIPPQPPHIASPQRQPIPPAPPVMDRRETRQSSKSIRPPPRQRSSPPKKKAKKVKPQKIPPVLPWDKSIAENNAIVDEAVAKHFAPKPPPPPKEKIPEVTVQHFLKQFEPPVKTVFSDYERSINKSFHQKGSRSSHSAGSNKCGKTVAQLGEQTVQSIAPLKVNTKQQEEAIGSKKCGKTVAQLGEQTVQSIAPLKVNTGKQQEVTDEQIALAAELGFTIEEFMNQFGLPDHEFIERRKYVPGEPMVTDEEEKLLSTQMRHLHQWYITEAIPFNIPGFWIPVKRDYFDNGTGDLWIANEELFQLFHQLALDKSIVSLYCL